MMNHLRSQQKGTSPMKPSLQGAPRSSPGARGRVSAPYPPLVFCCLRKSSAQFRFELGPEDPGPGTATVATNQVSVWGRGEAVSSEFTPRAFCALWGGGGCHSLPAVPTNPKQFALRGTPPRSSSGHLSEVARSSGEVTARETKASSRHVT